MSLRQLIGGVHSSGMPSSATGWRGARARPVIRQGEAAWRIRMLSDDGMSVGARNSGCPAGDGDCWRRWRTGRFTCRRGGNCASQRRRRRGQRRGGGGRGGYRRARCPRRFLMARPWPIGTATRLPSVCGRCAPEVGRFGWMRCWWPAGTTRRGCTRTTRSGRLRR